MSYIIERIISIAIFLLFIFFFSYLISKTDNSKKIKKLLILFVVVISILSFFYIPSETSDMSRLRKYFHSYYDNMTFSKYWSQLFATPVYTRHTYYYLVSLTGFEQLLSVFSSIINYSVISYVLYDYSKNHNIKGKSVANAMLLYIAIGEYLEVVSGFRSMCAFSLFFLCVYREFFKGKSIVSDIWIYILGIGFHNAVVPLVIVRFIYLLFQKEDNFVRRVLNYLLFLILVWFTINYGGDIIEATTSKAENYLSNDIFFYIWSYISSILTIALVCYIIFINRKTIKDKISKNYRIMFLIILVLDSVFMFIEYSIFRRYSRVVVMLFLPIIMECFNYARISNGRYIIRKQNVLYYFLLFIILFIEISRGDLCGIRFFTFG